MHKADDISEVRHVGEIDDELDEGVRLTMIMFVRSKRVMMNDELDEVMRLIMRRFVRSEKLMSDDELDEIVKSVKLMSDD